LCKNRLHEKHISCPETFGVIGRIGDISSGWDQVADHQKLAIKPANGSGGGGILILRKDEAGKWTSGGKKISEERLFTHMARIIMGMYSFGSKDQVLIEQCIEPHPFFHEIFPVGVPDFRVILLHNQAVMSMLRMPTEKSDGKANLHQGGLGIGIDMQKGILKQAYDGSKYFDIHPDNGHPIAGKVIPMWEDILALAIETSCAFPLNYLGVDIVLDETFGPMILEINVRPGLGIQLANQRGLKNLLHISNQKNL
jgi:alpha-L-glutamate ligase-like protein